MFRRPLFLPMLAWMAGILLARGAGIGLLLGSLLLACGLIGTLALSHRRAALLSLLALLAGLGTLRTLHVTQPPRYDTSRLLPSPATASGSRGDAKVALVGRLAADPTPYPNRLSFPLRVESAELPSGPVPSTGSVWVNLYPSTPSHPDTPTPQSPDAPSPLTSLTYGELVRVEGDLRRPPVARNPGDFDYRAYLARHGIHSILRVRAPDGVRRVQSAEFSWVGLCLAAKRKMESALEAALPREHSGFLAGLLFSERRQLPDALVDAFAATGTIHLLSTSGVHVAVLAGALHLLFGRARRRYKKPLALLFVLLLVAFGVMAGMRPAVARAVLMAGCIYAADLVDRDADGPNLLCLAALILLVLNPLDLYDMGFQFSFAAVAGLMLFAAPMEGVLAERLRLPVHSPLRTGVKLVAASLAVEAALWPLLALYLQEVSVLSPLANLIILPLSAPLIPLGLLQAIVGMIHAQAGIFLGFATSGLVEVVTRTLLGLAQIPGAVQAVPPPPSLLVGLYYSALIALARPWALKGDPLPSIRKPFLATPLRLSPPGFLSSLFPLLSSKSALRGAKYASPVLLVLLLLRGYFPSASPPLRITMIDVGQGDCILIRTPDGASMLVDGGGLRGYGEDPSVTFDMGERVVVPQLRRMGVRRLDVVVLSHPHDDHVGGLGAVMEEMPVRHVLESGDRGDTAAYDRFARAIRNRRVPRRDVEAGDSFQLGRETRVEILAPSEPRFSGTRSDPNNNSVVFRLSYRGFDALFTGDMEREAEDRLISQVESADLLKVAHHGSRFSTQEALVRRVRPKVALIGAGEHNHFGHPNPGVVRRLEAAGTAVFSTDRDGAITVETDGRDLRVTSFLRSGHSANRRVHPDSVLDRGKGIQVEKLQNNAAN